MQIALTTQLPSEGFRQLTEKVGRFLLYAPISEAEVLVSTFDKPVTREMIAGMARLRLVASFGVG